MDAHTPDPDPRPEADLEAWERLVRAARASGDGAMPEPEAEVDPALKRIWDAAGSRRPVVRLKSGA